MLLLWIAVFLVLAKGLDIGPVASWPWLVVLAPAAVAVVWFEFLEQVLGRDRRSVDADRIETARKERLAQHFDLRKPR
jgi:small Trp-rich protein